MLIRSHILAAGALLLPAVACAQNVGLPSQEDISKARERAREAVMKATGQTGLQGQPARIPAHSAPSVGALPKPAAEAPDISTIAERYKGVGRAFASGPSPEANRTDLLVLVSLSMPRQALERIVDQAERSGATLVFRGLKDGSMRRMAEEIRALIGSRNVNVTIHPPAFQQFSVTRVPAVVLARASASQVMEDGCALPDTFVKVSGDVSLDYALEYIERTSVAWAGDARKFRSKIVTGP